MKFPQLLLFSAIFQYLNDVALTYTSVSHSNFQRVPALSGKQFSDQVVFDVEARSALKCFALCDRSAKCVSLTVTSLSTSRVTCRGFQKLMTAVSPSAPDPNTAYYDLTASINPWFKFPCSDNAACEGLYSLAECFSGECLCPIGYSYSVSRSKCYVGACYAPGQQQPTFVTYPGLDLWYYDLGVIYVSVELCQTRCVAAYGPNYQSVVNNIQQSKCLCKNGIITPKNVDYNGNAIYMQPICA